MTLRRSFHQARWCEPIILELGRPGQRGYVVPPVEPELAEALPDPVALVPEGARRAAAPLLPELSQPEARKHFLRLSHETMGAAVGVDIGQGTATMKYSPVAHDRLAERIADVHPLQPAETVQGVLQIMHRFERVLCELSGLDRFSFQPGGGTHGIYANACIIRAYHASRGDGNRDEMITTLYSHPANAAAPARAGFRIVTLQPGPNGFPTVAAMKAALSERTAGFVVANPEDTGIFNPQIDRLVDLVHDAGGLCAYDQANANGLLGIARAGDAGFDLCQFNLHKTFGTPHACGGLACGAIGVRAELARFLPAPTVEHRESGFFLDDDRPESIGKVRAFYGVVQTVLRAYAWTLGLGPEGIRDVAETAVLNSNYLSARLLELPEVGRAYDDGNGPPRLEQIRYTLARLKDETGVDTEDVSRRTADFGVAGYFPSHHPWTVAEPMTLEPTESPSKAELDDYVEILRTVIDEAHRDPDRVRRAPERCTTHRIDESALDDPARWALTWRAYVRKRDA